MKNLFLTSYFSGVASVFEETEESLSPGKTVTFIPTASINEEVNFYVEDARKSLEKMGLQIDVIDVSSKEPNSILSSLARNDFIYVSGGNTFFLLQELKRTGADKEIIRQVNSGKTYIGESAGSMILSPDIEYVRDMDDESVAPFLDSYEALKLIDFYPLPHYANEPFIEVTEAMKSKYSETIQIEPFSNTEAFRVKDQRIQKYKISA